MRKRLFLIFQQTWNKKAWTILLFWLEIEIGKKYSYTPVLPGACNWQMPISVLRKEAFWILL